jgi:hypothetical protein
MNPIKQTVRVWDKPREITVYQESKSVWIAIGDDMDERVEVKASSASAAARHWQEAGIEEIPVSHQPHPRFQNALIS